MTEFNYESHVSGALKKKAPLALFPLRLETRYVRQGNDQSLTGTAVVLDDLVIYGERQLPYTPSGALEGSMKFATQLQQLQQSLTASGQDSKLNISIAWRIAILETRLGAWSAAASNAYRMGMARLSENQKVLTASTARLVPSQVSSDEKGNKYPRQAGRIRAISDTISKLNKETRLPEAATTTADSLLAKQDRIIQYTNSLAELCTDLVFLKGELADSINQSIDQVKNTLESWNRSTVHLIREQENKREILEERLSKSVQLLKHIEQTFLAKTEYAPHIFFWKNLESLRLQVDLLGSDRQTGRLDAMKVAFSRILELLTNVSAELGEAVPMNYYDRISLGNVFAQIKMVLPEIVRQQQEILLGLESKLTIIQRFIDWLRKYDMAGASQGSVPIDKAQMDMLYDLYNALEATLHTPLANLSVHNLALVLSHQDDYIYRLQIKFFQLRVVQCDDAGEIRDLLALLLQNLQHWNDLVTERIKVEKKEIQSLGLNYEQINSLVTKYDEPPKTGMIKAWNQLDHIATWVRQFETRLDIIRAIALPDDLSKVTRQLGDIKKFLPEKKEIPLDFQYVLVGLLGKIEIIGERGLLFYSDFINALIDEWRYIKTLVESIAQTDNIPVIPCADNSYFWLKGLIGYYIQEVTEITKTNPFTKLHETEFILKNQSRIREMSLDILDKFRRIEGLTIEEKNDLQADLDRLLKPLSDWLQQVFGKIAKMRSVAIPPEKIGQQLTAQIKAVQSILISKEKEENHFKVWRFCARIETLVTWVKFKQAIALVDYGEDLQQLIEDQKLLNTILGNIVSLPMQVKDEVLLYLQKGQRLMDELGILLLQDTKGIRTTAGITVQLIDKINTMFPLVGQAEQPADIVNTIIPALKNLEIRAAALQVSRKNPGMLLAGTLALNEAMSALIGKIDTTSGISRRESTHINSRKEAVLGKTREWLNEINQLGDLLSAKQAHYTAKAASFQQNRLVAQSLMATMPVEGQFAAAGYGRGPSPHDLPVKGTPTPVLVPDITPGEYELWIRAYPDVIAIDSHDPDLTRAEIESARHYWKIIWESGKNENTAMGAWRMIAMAHGSERAAYLVKTMTPTNMGDQPQNAAAVNGAPKPLYPTDIALRDNAFPRQPRSYILPDRIVFVLYNEISSIDSIESVYVGKPIPQEIKVGVDFTDADAIANDGDGNLVVRQDIKWMFDFSTAVDIGMAIRIPLGTQPKSFTKMIALGIRTTKPNEALDLAAYSKTILEQLFRAHHYSAGGLSFVPPGTPTNNTSDTTSPYLPFVDPEQSFHTEIKAGRFALDQDPMRKADGQILAEALGLDTEVFQNIHKSDGYTIRNASAMNFSLWPATLDSFFENMFGFYETGDHMFNIPEDLDTARGFMSNYVCGRGFLPSIRVGQQPYGILPIGSTKLMSAFSSHALPKDYSDNDTIDTYLKSADDYDIWNWFSGSSNHKNIARVLLRLKVQWDRVVIQDIRNIIQLQEGSEISIQEHLMYLMGLQANSIEFYNRYAIGSNDIGLWKTLFGEGNDWLEDSTSFGKAFRKFMFEHDSDGPLHWSWGNIDEQNGDSSFQTIGQMRHLNTPFSVLDGNLVDVIKSSEVSGLSPIDGTTTDNYINWLLNNRLATIFNASVQGEEPSNSLLYLLLRTSLLYEYRNAAMNIYAVEDIKDLRYSPIPFLTQEYRNDFKAPWAEGEWKSPKIDRKNYQSFVIGWKDLYKLFESVYVGLNGEGLQDTQEIINALREMHDLFIKTYISKKGAFLTYNEWFDLIDENSNLYDTSILNYGDVLHGVSLEVNNDLFIRAQGRMPFLFFILDTGEFGIGQGEFLADGMLWTMANYLQHTNKGYNNYPAETDALKKVVKEYLPLLAQLPTAELERLTAEHIDLCSHRLDAWILGLFNYVLDTIRKTPDTNQGIYIGAYGYLENLARGQSRIKYKAPGTSQTDELIQIDAIGNNALGVLAHDLDNQGFIHAPSLTHAMTAAVLRAGYVATGEDNPSLQVGLSSERVSKGLWYLDGIRNGLPLAVLLGYQLERGFHNSGLDKYIYNLREKFFLAVAAGQDENLAANNVVNGLKLLEDYRKSPSPSDFVNSLNLDGFESADSSKIELIFDRMEDALDSVSDLLLAEGVYQMVQGNTERSKAIQRAMSQGERTPEIEIADTPRSGNALTHRMGIFLGANPLAKFSEAWSHVPASPRSKTEPAINRWLAERVGDPNQYKCVAKYSTQSDPQTKTEIEISLSDLSLQPIDLVLMSNTPLNGLDSEFDQRMRQVVVEKVGEALAKIEMDYNRSITAQAIAFLSLFPVLREYRATILAARPLRADDLVHHSFALPKDNQQGIQITELEGRINGLYVEFKQLISEDINDLEQSLTQALVKLNGAIDNGQADTNFYKEVYKHLKICSGYNLPGAVAVKDFDTANIETHKRLQQKAKSVEAMIKQRKEKAEEKWTQIQNVTTVDQWIELARIILGSELPVLPVFSLHNPLEIHKALKDSDIILPQGDSNLLEMEAWLAGVSRVRKRVGQLEKTILLDTMLQAGPDSTMVCSPLQLPYRANDHWVGLELPEHYFDEQADSSRDKLSLVLVLDGSKDTILDWINGEPPETENLFAGLMIDDWPEVIPEKQQTTGIAFHYNQPNAEAPQAVLLSLPDNNDETPWTFTGILNSIETAMEMAKMRAVEPDHLTKGLNIYNYQRGQVKDSGTLFFSQLLPGIVSRVVNFNEEFDFSTDFNTVSGQNARPPLFGYGTAGVPDTGGGAQT